LYSSNNFVFRVLCRLELQNGGVLHQSQISALGF
jgi:hypothetical protein